MEAIVEKALGKYGRVSDRRAEKLLDAQIDDLVAKDDLHDRLLQEK
jgi:hypothetical protein